MLEARRPAGDSFAVQVGDRGIAQGEKWIFIRKVYFGRGLRKAVIGRC